GNMAEISQDLCELQAPGKLEADTTVARQVAGARKHEVAQPRESHERVPPAAKRPGQPPDLRKAPRDQRGARVVAATQAVARTGSDRLYVLPAATELDTGEVVAFIGAQRVGTQQR